MKLGCLSRAGVFWDSTCQWSLWNGAWKCGVPVKRKVDTFYSLMSAVVEELMEVKRDLAMMWSWSWQHLSLENISTCILKKKFFHCADDWLAGRKKRTRVQLSPKQSRFARGHEEEKKTEARRAHGVSERQDVGNCVAWQARCSLSVNQQSHHGPRRSLRQTLTRQYCYALSLCCETLQWKYGGSWQCRPNERLLFHSEEVKKVLALLAEFCVWCIGQQHIHSGWQVCHSGNRSATTPFWISDWTWRIS